MASRFTKYGGALGADAELRQMVAERIAAEMEQRKQQVENYKLSQADRGMDLEGQRIDVSKGDLGLRTRVHDEGAPQREAQTGYIRTQTADLEGKPMREADARAHAGMMQERGHQNELAQIGAQGQQNRQTAQAGAGLRTTNERIVQVEGPDGKSVWVRESDAVNKPAAQAARAITGSERKELGFFQRMLDAERNARKVEDDVSGWDISVGDMAPGFLENWLKSDKGKQYTQAQRMFTEGRLRADSGAAVPQPEYDTDRKTNFRIGNDDKATIAQKRNSRLTAMRGQANRAGRALQEYYGEGSSIDSLLSEFADQQAAVAGATPPAGPAVGTRGTVNGVPAIWDGRGWLPAGGQ